MTIPVIFVAVPDPVGAKLVASLAHPGGNITGLSNFAHDLTGKRVEYLKQIVPSVSRIALLVNPSNKASSETYIEEAQKAADKLGLALSSDVMRLTVASLRLSRRLIGPRGVSTSDLFVRFTSRPHKRPCGFAPACKRHEVAGTGTGIRRNSGRAARNNSKARAVLGDAA